MSRVRRAKAAGVALEASLPVRSMTIFGEHMEQTSYGWKTSTERGPHAAGIEVEKDEGEEGWRWTLFVDRGGNFEDLVRGDEVASPQLAVEGAERFLAVAALMLSDLLGRFKPAFCARVTDTAEDALKEGT